MCLRNAVPVRLTEPMKVYKVFMLAVDPEGNEHIRSPYFTNYVWAPGMNCSGPIDTHSTDIHKELTDRYNKGLGKIALNGGAFHSFANKSDAERLVRALEKDGTAYLIALANILICTGASKADYVVGECTVPQNCEYVFEGTFEILPYDEPAKSVASKKLILNRILKK
ncbi:MAG: hypothetical protein J6X18_05700 [Bacteroidales bacterium]|nr:hypothetical protein [Bacteroidales bacterium]